jgi:segregation and condensation protein B
MSDDKKFSPSVLVENPSEIQSIDMDEEINSIEELEDVLADFNEAESDATLSQMETAMRQHDEKAAQELTEQLAESSSDLEELNAAMIAEDELLQEQTEAEALAEEAGPTLVARDADGNLDPSDLESSVEALLFLSDKPISATRLLELLELTPEHEAALSEALVSLQARYNESYSGLECIPVARGYQIRTKPAKADLIKKLAKVQFQRLSRGAMETLSIIALKQPCLKDDVDTVRGVDSSHFVRTLLDRGLIEVTGRSDAVGRPMTYATTDRFLEVFSLPDLSAIPSLREIESLVPQSEQGNSEEISPAVQKMRTLVGQMNIEASLLDQSAAQDEQDLKEIRDRVKAIPISTPFLEAEKQEQAQEKSELF